MQIWPQKKMKLKLKLDLGSRQLKLKTLKEEKFSGKLHLGLFEFLLVADESADPAPVAELEVAVFELIREQLWLAS